MLFEVLLLIVCLFLAYTVLPNAAMRKWGIGIVKNVRETSAIALTFDDGPDPVYTERLLTLLKTYDVRATFFVVGEKVERYPHIVRQMAQEGHVIGIHHHRHISSWLLGPFALKRQLVKCEEAIAAVTGERPYFYRPPWGHLNFASLFAARNYKIVMWSHILGDWKSETAELHLLDKLRNARSSGSIIVLHDSGDTFGAEEEAPGFMLDSLEVFLKENRELGISYFTLQDAYTPNQRIRGYHEQSNDIKLS